ncbi:hypothetical protein EHS25_008779 [Saitozyma podzolica]|uniref:Uncharacterized protein n=1 Tax=Saitozyma podzolica TaxID=1890683 RepID=A0A427YMN0_9TREE|nr:hypothetical protein EHS25_008779 [Saitozyma podzolica]
MPIQSTLRSSALTPTPSPLSHPDLLLRIFSQADNPTLATCLRASKAWYDLAGPILYRIIECRDLEALEDVLRGSEIVNKAVTTRSGPCQRNFKSGLLRHTRYLYTGIETGTPTSDALYRLAELSKQLKLWVDLRGECVNGVYEDAKPNSTLRARIFLDPGYRSHPHLESSSTSSTQWQRHIGGLIAVYCSIRNDTETVDIYFMDDQRWQAEANRVWSPLECKNLVRAEFSKWPRYRKYLDAVTLKTRADYLAEAVKDEYSEEELENQRELKYSAAYDREVETSTGGESRNIMPNPTTSPIISAIASVDILCLILAQADNATLSRCLRVSKAWYDFAGPLLYRHVECSTTNALERLMVGINVRAGTVSTRRSRVGTNLKKDLLGHIKEISVSLEVCSTAVDRLHQLIEHTTNVEVEIQPEDRCYCDRIQRGKIHGPTGPRFFSAQGVSWCCRMQAYQISPLVVLFVTAKTHGPFWHFATLRDSIKICHRQKGELRVYIMDDMPAPYEYDGDDNTDGDSEEDQEGNTTGNTTGDTEGDTGAIPKATPKTIPYGLRNAAPVEA